MAIESKIRELLSKSREVEAELNEEVTELDEKTAAARPLDKDQGDATNPTQGSSNPNPEQQDLSGTGDAKGGLTAPVGKAAAAKAGSATAPQTTGAGQAPNFTDQTGSETVVAQSSSKGNVAQEETEEDEDQEVVAEDETSEEEVEVVAEDETSEEETVEAEAETETEEETLFENDIQNLFADEEHLSEDFKVKAAQLFEAVVTARVANEMEKIEKELAEEADIQKETFKEEMVQKIDQYLNYVAENWMKENELAIERGLRTEITEDFIKGMKTLFAEHYIDVPQDKYDVLGEMQDEIEDLKKKLNESVEEKISITNDKINLQRAKVVAEQTDDLTVTEKEKLESLIEDIEFGSEEIFAEKVAVIKENYFPKQQTASSSDDKLEDTVAPEFIEESGTISRYAQAITKSVRK